MHEKIGKDRACGSGGILADRQTDTVDTHRHTHTDALITVLCHRSGGRSNKPDSTENPVKAVDSVPNAAAVVISSYNVKLT